MPTQCTFHLYSDHNPSTDFS